METKVSELIVYIIRYVTHLPKITFQQTESLDINLISQVTCQRDGMGISNRDIYMVLINRSTDLLKTYSVIPVQ